MLKLLPKKLEINIFTVYCLLLIKSPDKYGICQAVSSGLSMTTAYIMQMFLFNHKSKLCGGENIKTVAASNPPLPFYK
jgi:hypothetical protein